MKKIVRITESDLKRIAKKVIKEDDQEMSGAAHRRDFKPTPREKQLQGVFGDMYGEDVPPVVIRYMRKNPEKIIQRLYDVYGEKIYDIISDYSQGEMDAPLDEAKQVTSTQYDLGNAQDVADFNRDKKNVTDVDKIKVGQNMAQIDSSYDPTLDESDDNPFADVPMWKGKR
jgi:hypothetical protein